jgi:hypothetical protein
MLQCQKSSLIIFYKTANGEIIHLFFKKHLFVACCFVFIQYLFHVRPVMKQRKLMPYEISFSFRIIDERRKNSDFSDDFNH